MHTFAMSDYRRIRRPGAPVFFTVCLAHPGTTLLVSEIARLRAAARRTLAERPVEILAWVVLPDHMHCIWRMPEGDSDYSTRWRLIKARFSRELPPGPLRDSHLTRRERGIWQRRFWEHHLRSDAAIAQAIRQCWNDPVRHGLVSRPEDWTFSSIHRDLGRIVPAA